MADSAFLAWGEIDIASAPELLADLRLAIAGGVTDLEVDCTHLTFIDSTGVLALLEANETLEGQGRRMQIINLAPGPRRVLDILGLNARFGVESLVAT